ncbi:uncharacterized protein LOC119741055 [Patiria miniata]|uniref:Ig-like domain-containing protein n=1 Tax=Patiria miniata TaxID=46514 RepID=A0A914B943_PATMI|nr:uncharacterized protein LOC119741055 [Patiria miniata]
MYLSNEVFLLQRDLTQHIRCPVPREDDQFEWTRDVLREGDWHPTLVARFSSPESGTNYTISDHYGLMPSSHDLIIKNTKLSDEGVYHCGPSGKEFRFEVSVLDTTFPVFDDILRPSNESLMLPRGQMHIINCPVTTALDISGHDTVYWTLDVGKENYTSVIGAVFSDGEALVTDAYQGRYNINEERNLVVNSLEGAENRYWCNVFKIPHGLSTGYIDVTGKVTTQQEFPYISGCDKSEVECSIEVDQITSLNCSVANLYPMANLSWSLSGCEAGDRPPFLTNTSSVFDPGSETFNQSQELTISGNTTFRCTFTCEASGLSIANSSIAKSVNVTWKEHNVIEQGNPIGIALAIALPLLVLVVVVIPIIIVVCKKKRTRTENRHIRYTKPQGEENGVSPSKKDDRDDNAADGAEPLCLRPLSLP